MFHLGDGWEEFETLEEAISVAAEYLQYMLDSRGSLPESFTIYEESADGCWVRRWQVLHEGNIATYGNPAQWVPGPWEPLTGDFPDLPDTTLAGTGMPDTSLEGTVFPPELSLEGVVFPPELSLEGVAFPPEMSLEGAAFPELFPEEDDDENTTS